MGIVRGIIKLYNNNNKVSQVIEFALKMWICQTAVVLIPVHLLMDSKSVHFLPILKYEPNGPLGLRRQSMSAETTQWLMLNEKKVLYISILCLELDS